MVKSNTFSKYAKKESANVRKCLREGKNKAAAKSSKAVEYVSNKKRNNKKFQQKFNNMSSKNDSGDDSDGSNEGSDDEKLPNGRPQPLPKNMKVEFPTYEVMPSDSNFIRLHDAGHLSRLLYPNPVCFLTTIEADGSKRNVMTLSWLCPANNYGGFVFVIHKTRHSAANLSHHKTFNLSIASAAQLEVLSAIGKCSGKMKDKFDGSIVNLSTVSFGRYSSTSIDVSNNNGLGKSNSKWEYLPENTKEIVDKSKKSNVNSNAFGALDESSDEESENKESEEQQNDVNKEVESSVNNKDEGVEVDSVKKGKVLSDALFIEHSIAHLRCKVVSMSDAADAGHYLVIANLVEGAVHPQYWAQKNKCLVPSSKELPSIVSFLGSQQFGTTNPIEL